MPKGEKQQFIYEPLPEAGKHREFKQSCKECGNNFVQSIPEAWFYDRNGVKHDDIQDYNISAPEYNAKKAKASLDESICGICKNRDVMDAVGRQAYTKQLEEIAAKLNEAREYMKVDDSGSEKVKIKQEIEQLEAKEVELNQKLSAIDQKNTGQKE